MLQANPCPDGLVCPTLNYFDKGVDMKREIVKQVYAYGMCAIALGCGMIFLGVGIWGIVKIASPEFTMPQWEWKKVATFQSFKTDWEREVRTEPAEVCIGEPEEEGASKLTDEELKIRWQDKREVALMSEKREGWQNLTSLLICFVIVTPIFIIHWRVARKLREE